MSIFMYNSAEIRSYSRTLFKKIFPLILFQLVILTCVNFCVAVFSELNPSSCTLVNIVASLLIAAVTYLLFTYGFAYICLCLWRGKSFKFSDYFHFRKSPRLIFAGLAIAAIYYVLVFFATFFPMLLALLPLGVLFHAPFYLAQSQ